MASKPKVEAFTQDWNKTVEWAKANKIPYQAYYPVYEMDSQRLLAGNAMTQSERIRAVQAAVGLNVSTALPSDVPSPGDVVGNIQSNAANIFTGLEPQNLVSNMWDTVTNTIEHPSNLIGAVGDFFKILNPLANSQQTKNAIGAFDQHVLASHSILSWVPGLSDAAMLTSGGILSNDKFSGAKYLADNPLTTLLDVMPLGRTIPRSLADSAKGADIASQLGTTRDALSKMDAMQFAYRMLKSKVLPWEKTAPYKHPAILTDAAGNMLGFRPMNIGERINAFRNTANIGKEQGDLMMGAVLKSEDGTRRLIELAGPAVEALGSLSKDQYMEAMKALASDHRPQSDILDDDDKYSEPVRVALGKVYDYAHIRLQTKLQTGEMVAVDTEAYGREYYSVKPGSSGATVVRALERSKADQATLDKAARPLDALIYKTQMSDRKMQGAFQALQMQTTAIFNSIKRTIPEIDNERIRSGVRETLPIKQRWDRVVADQTPLIHNLLGLGPEEKLTLHHVNSIRDLFQPGGLLDQMSQAYQDQDWIALSKYSKVAMRKFENKVFDKLPRNGNAFLFKTKVLTKQLHDYAVTRERDVNAMNRLLNGTRHGVPLAGGKLVKNSILGLSRKAADSHQAFLKTAIDHPPDVWRNTYLDLYVDQIMNNEKSASLVDDAARALVDRGYRESEVEKMRQDPRTIVELVVRSSKNSVENSMMPDIEIGLAKELSEDAYTELSRLRAQGLKPAYIPLLSPHDIKAGVEPTYNVSIGSLRPRSVGSTFTRSFDFTSSIYDVQLGILQDAKDQITKDVIQEFKDEYVSKHLRPVGEMNEIASHYVQEELAHNVLKMMESGVREEAVDTIVLNQIKRMGYISYDPKNIFGALSAAKLDKPYYIDQNLSSALEKAVGNFDFPAQGFWDKGTKIFRFSILGLSPRYTAHILFGGTWLLAARGHASMFSQLRAGWHIATTGMLPAEIHDEVHGMFGTPRQAIRDYRIARQEKNQQVLADLKQRYPKIEEHMTSAATQEGQADMLWHKAAGYTMGNKIIQEFMANHKMAGTAYDWLKAASQVNFRFTRSIVKMQRAITYLDGAARAEKEGSFTEKVLVPRVDENGQRITHPLTGKQLFDEREQVSKMTPERAHQEGMRAVAEVMGELRHMTPLERTWLTRVFPFYGWTKHVLTYVLTYPVDHPYRAMFLSQLATQNSQDVASGLPTRIQLLMFLGHPDEYGNVSAVDARFMDPLRDTANYASLTGFFQSLNPILSAPLATVDPQVTFGGNEIYPNVTYSQLYGVKEAGPQGDLYNAAEQFVPQLQAVDEAFNLSGQYAYLKSTNSNAFAKKVFESLNVPFFQVQHINLRQIAAQNELDRYSIASNAAYEAASTGDMSFIAGYPATAELPDPLNTQYNVTPAYIQAMTQESEQRTGLPFTETVAPPPNPGV